MGNGKKKRKRKKSLYTNMYIKYNRNRITKYGYVVIIEYKSFSDCLFRHFLML